jgi:hypothetical protein
MKRQRNLLRARCALRNERGGTENEHQSRLHHSRDVIISCWIETPTKHVARDRAGDEARVDDRAPPPRTDDTAGAVPSSSRDAGNRISFAGLRGCTATRDSAKDRAATESRVQSGLLDAVSAILRPRPSSRGRPVIHSRHAGACSARGRSASDGGRTQSGGRRAEGH